MNTDTTEEQPAVLEFTGHELLNELPRLRARGAFAWSMVAVCNGRWRVFLRWPEPTQTELLPDARFARLRV